MARPGIFPAGITFKEEPITSIKSHALEASEALAISSSFIGCPKEIVATLLFRRMKNTQEALDLYLLSHESSECH